jgi:hypothetical protein
MDETSIPAYDCQELGEILPKQITVSDIMSTFVVHPTDKELSWHCAYGDWIDGVTGFINFKFDGETMAEAMGKLLLSLLENNLFEQSSTEGLPKGATPTN